MVPRKANRRINYKAPATPVAPATPETVAAFMLSGKGYYNGDVNCAALAALDHAANASGERFEHWMSVYSLIKLWNFDTPKGKGN